VGVPTEMCIYAHTDMGMYARTEPVGMPTPIGYVRPHRKWRY
jgi:hypothetical protein